MRVHRAVYAATTAALLALMAITLLDIRNPVLGVDSAHVTATSDDGATLVVEYPEVTRPALASPFTIEVTFRGGFSAPIELAIARPWIEMWDENGLYPTPASETGDPDWVVYEFEPPEGDTFRFFYDARLEPARQDGADGAVQLRVGRVAVAQVDFRTEVRP
jgi:hypothetical protein